jgi:hypothetical protein
VSSAVLATIGLFAIVPSAWADSCANTGRPGARACFEDRGQREYFNLYDNANDNYAVYVAYRYRGGGEQRAYNRDGYGSVERIRVNIPENRRIMYKACVDRPGPRDYCSEWRQDRS